MRKLLLVVMFLPVCPTTLLALELPADIGAKLPEAVSGDIAAEKGFIDSAVTGGKTLYFHWAIGGKNATDVATTVTSIKPGLFREEIVTKSADGSIVTEVRVSALGGLLPLITEEQPKTDTAVDEALAEYDVDGSLFPLSVGNEFEISWQSAIMGTSEPFMKSEHECEVTKVIEASAFMAGLSGKAIEVACDVELMGKDVGSEVYYYLADIGYFVADSSRSKLTTGFDVKFVAQ
jgi:hypothetical protein